MLVEFYINIKVQSFFFRQVNFNKHNILYCIHIKALYIKYYRVSKFKAPNVYFNDCAELDKTVVYVSKQGKRVQLLFFHFRDQPIKVHYRLHIFRKFDLQGTTSKKNASTNVFSATTQTYRTTHQTHIRTQSHILLNFQ